jgi:hypothetical protein
MDHALPAGSPSPASAFDLRARARAAILHLGLSLLVAALAAALVFGFWYPMPYREISGGRELFLLIVAIDVVVGPLLTFAVFDRRKPRRELRRDLAIIVLLQLIALGYGLHTVERARPAAVALEAEGQRLRVVRAIELDDAALARAPAGLRQIPWFGHLEVAARTPDDPKLRIEAIERALAGEDIGVRPELWLPPAQTAAAMLEAARPFEQLRQRYPARAAELDAAVAATGLAESRLKYLPLLARATDWVALIDGENGKIVGHAHVDGF